MSLSKETDLSPKTWEEDEALSGQEEGEQGVQSVSERGERGQEGMARPHPPAPRQLALLLEARAPVSLRESTTSKKKAGHALLLLRGQWTISLFLKDPAGERRRGGKQSGLESLGRPQSVASISD